MSWSWSNPSPEEAEEAYYYYRGKYINAASQKRQSEQQEQQYIVERSAARAQMGILTLQKKNAEKRHGEVERILRMLQGSSGAFFFNVPASIAKAQKTLEQANSSFHSSVKLTGGSGSANLETAFAIKTVEADAHSASALASFMAELVRLEQEIADLTTQISNLDSLIVSLTNKIKACNATQDNLQAQMNSYAYDMNHYKKYMY